MEGDFLESYKYCPRCGSQNVYRDPNGSKTAFGCHDCGFTTFINRPKNVDNYVRARLEKWAREVKMRDGNKCVICGSTDNLDAHHIIPKNKHPELEFKVENGVTLCREHHAMVHPYMINYMKKVRENDGH